MVLDLAFEACVDSVESALAAEAGGADRVELCSCLSEGGVTPSYGLIRTVVSCTSLPIHVLIRPRAGDFVFSELELQVMEADIQQCANLGAKGVVLGGLTDNGEVDKAAMSRLLDLARSLSLSCTFHRAFDFTQDPHQALEVLIRLGFHRLLTSGQSLTAESGAPLIHDLVKQSGGRISIMAGGGVSASNARHILQSTGIQEVHGSARVRMSAAQSAGCSKSRNDAPGSSAATRATAAGGACRLNAGDSGRVSRPALRASSREANKGEWDRQVTSAAVVREIKNIMLELKK